MTKEYLVQKKAEAKNSVSHAVLVLRSLIYQFDPEFKDDDGKSIEAECNSTYEALKHLVEAEKELNK